MRTLLMFMPGHRAKTSSVLGKPRHINTDPSSTRSLSPSYYLLPLARSSLRSSTLSSTLKDHSWALLTSASEVVMGHLSHPSHWTVDFSKSEPRSRCLVCKRYFKTPHKMEEMLLTEQQRQSWARSEATFTNWGPSVSKS